MRASWVINAPRGVVLAIVVLGALELSPILTAGNLGFDTASAHPGGGAGGGGGGGPGGGGGGPGAGGGDGGNGHAAVGVGVGVSASAGANSQGSVSSQLGNLNAAHASKTALSHANPHSMVGKIAAYKAAVLALIAQNKNTTAKDISLAQPIANKTVTPAVISALNSLLGLN